VNSTPALLFRWFVGLGIDDAVWDASTFSKNRDRLLGGSVAAAFLSAVLAIPRVMRLLSNDHFSVDGTLIAAWASMKAGAESRAQWRAVYDEVRRRRASGETLLGIARVMSLARATVRKYATADVFPARLPTDPGRACSIRTWIIS